MVRRDMGQRVLTRNAALYYNTINNKKERRGCESVSGAVFFAEAVYLLYYFVNEVSYEEEFARICKCYCRKADEEEEGMMRRIQELTRVSRVVTADLDRGVSQAASLL